MAVDIHHGYQFITPIVGESHYTDILKKCYNDPDAYKKGKSVFIDVKLVMQDDNPYDNQAVAVVSPYGTIGHLSKTHAHLYRQDYDEPILTVRAKIYSNTGQLFGVWVDLEYDENDKPKHPKQQSRPKISGTTANKNTMVSKTPKPKNKGFLTRLLGL